MPPLTWPLLCLIAGILASPYLDTRYAPVSILVVCLIAWRRPALIFVAVVLGGAVLGNHHLSRVPPAIDDDGLARRVTLTLAKPPESQGGAVYFLADILAVDGAPVASGRARLAWFPDDYGSAEVLENLELGRGDRVEVLVRLRRPNAYRNPGVFDYSRFLERQGIYWVGTIRSPRLIEVVERGWHGGDRIREWTADRIARYFPDPTIRSLVLGMVLGQRRLLPPEDDRKFEEAGLIHLLVVSGFNLAVVAGAAVLLARRVAPGRYQRAALALVFILGYASLVEGGPPVLRATLMASLLLTGTALDRGYGAGNALALTAIIILALEPRSLGDQSFLLSFGAVAAILLIGAPTIAWTHRRVQPALRYLGRTELDRHLDDEVVDLRVALRLRAELGGWPIEWVALPWRAGSLFGEVALITAGIQAVLLPSAIESFHRVAPVSVPLNVLGAVIASLVTPLGLVLIFLPELPGSALAWVLRRLLELLALAVDGALGIPGATMRVPSPPPGLWIGFAAGLTSLGIAVAARKHLATVASLILTLAMLLAMLLADFSPAAPPHPVLTFLDVGQGDSVLIEMPDGQTVVVDGGGAVSSDHSRQGGFRVGEDVVSHYLFARRYRRIDTLVLTHAHHDHMDGLFDLIRNFEIGEIWLGPNPMTPRYRELIEALYIRGIPIRHVRSGDRMGAFEVLNPARDSVVASQVRNDDSVVLLLRWGGRTALLTGDLEGTLSLTDDRVDVLKVPHHGSANTKLRAQGSIPVISVGANNRYGHPAPRWLPALRTDSLGAIEVSLRPSGPRVAYPGLR